MTTTADRQIVRCAELPAALGVLRAAARAEGFDFLERVFTRWRGDRYLNDEDACVLAAYVDGEPAAIGAQTLDEHDPHPDHRRLRHFYVLPTFRRAGVGRKLASALMQEALHLAPILHLRATHAVSTAFWDAMGFERVVGVSHRTHRIVRA